MAPATIADIREINFPVRPSDEATLWIYEHGAQVPFSIERVFVVTAQKTCNRGHHAHRECAQILVCLNGAVTLIVKDGRGARDIMLDNPAKGILIPPGIWGEQAYTPGSILMVLTDRRYDEADYIRDYADFLKYRGVAA